MLYECCVKVSVRNSLLAGCVRISVLAFFHFRLVAEFEGASTAKRHEVRMSGVLK